MYYSPGQVFSFIITGLLAIVVLTFLRAWAIGTLWFWYIVPTFDIQPLSLASAFGIGLFVKFISNDPKFEDSNKSEGNDNAEQKLFLGIMSQVATVLFIVFLGWLGTFFM